MSEDRIKRNIRKMIDQGASEQEIDAYIASEGATVPKQPSLQQEMRNPKTGMRATLDAAATIGTGMVSGPVAGLAGVAGAALPGSQGQGADWVRKTQEAMTWQPRTQGGQAMVGAIAAPFDYLAKKADQLGGVTTDATGSPALGTAANVTAQALPAVVAKGAQVGLKSVAKRSNAKLADAKSRNAVRDATLEAARREGYGVPQSEITPGIIGNAVESVGGKAAIKQQFDLNNQEVTNKIARREAGLAENEALSEGALEAARTRMAAPYAQVASVSPRASVALEKLKQARSDAKVYWRHYQVSADPASLKRAQATDKKALLYEKVIDAEAQRAGQPQLITQLRDARKALAKNYAVDRALNASDGNVDALAIGKMRRKDEPLEGGLKVIGDFAEAFPSYARPASKTPPPGVNNLTIYGSAGLSFGGAAALGPAGAVAGVAPFVVPPLARSLVLSRQNPMTYNSKLGGVAAVPIAEPLIGMVGMPQNRK